MNLESLVTGLIVCVPLLLFSIFFVPRAIAVNNPERLANITAIFTLIGLLLALSASSLLVFTGPVSRQIIEIGPFHLGIYFDALSATLLLLISFLAVVIARFSRNYLQGDAVAGRFFKWFCVTTGAALTLVISGNLVLFTLAWMLMSLSLHKLLTIYPDRPAALTAARKKFVISRLGDACLLAVIVLTYRLFGSWDFDLLFKSAQSLAENGANATQRAELTWISLLLVSGAMLKSAQFPFHSWLPDTMETPTPVSAIMHAGIINAGGFLIIRLSPIVSLTPLALDILIVVGAFTAIFAALVMTTQTSVKRSLAFSTIAQMGFMMLQCGLGAFSVAVLHIVAHSLYKAHAFLGSGSVVAKAQPESAEVTATKPILYPLAVATSVLVMLGVGALLGVSIGKEPGAILLGGVMAVGIAGFVANLWKSEFSPALLLFGIGAATGLSVAYFALHLGFHHLLDGTVSQSRTVSLAEMLAPAIGIAVLIACLLLPRIAAGKVGELRRALYVHATNGFYLSTIANRLIARF